MLDNIIKRLGNLLSVKSLVTLMLTIVFCALSYQGRMSQNFMVVYTTIICFYFGTQSQKLQDAVDKATGGAVADELDVGVDA